MPHLQLDHSPNLNPESLLQPLVAEFCKIETVDPAAVKAYARPASAYEPGYQAPQGFVHLSICVLSGRPQERLQEMSDRLYEVGRSFFKGNVPFPISWTLEIREMEPSTYKKSTVG